RPAFPATRRRECPYDLHTVKLTTLPPLVASRHPSSSRGLAGRPAPPFSPGEKQAMNWFRNLPIARKLAMAFTVTVILTVLLGALSLWRLSVANAQMRAVNENWMPAVQHLGEMRAQLGEYRTYEQSQLTKQGQPDEIADYEKKLADTRKLIDAEEAAYNAIPIEP